MKKLTLNSIYEIVVLLVLLALVVLYLWVPINLVSCDVGRHLKNGEFLLSGHTEILYKNFYSFSYPDYPFINHHWLTGVIFYGIFHCCGFTGLSIFYILLILSAFILFFDSARRISGFHTAVFFAVLSFLLVVDRKEIRPEGFSVFFMGLYFYLLTRFQEKTLSPKMLFGIIPFVQLLWVNIHIFFFLGPMLIAIFLWQAQSSKEDVKHIRTLLMVLVLSVIVNVLNPSGIAGVLTPLNGFKKFGYDLAENQNVVFMMRRFPQVVLYKLYFVVTPVLGLVALWGVCRDGVRRHWPMLVLMIFVMAAGFKAVRLLMPYGFFYIPLGAYFGNIFLKHFKYETVARIVIVVLLMEGMIFYAFMGPKNPSVGLAPKVNASVDFFKKNGLKGPIFSNYDIGGYLIYHFSDTEKLFVDNRQEAYPVDFFQKIYIPMQQNTVDWTLAQDRYNFNLIYFYRNDLTPWGQKFMISRIVDPAWAPIYIDNYVVVIARRDSVNQKVIDQFEIPQSMFKVAHQNQPSFLLK
ncbi:MAG: hypothetical protein HQL15_08505 [Candidatus Omnitrophica bacterium]|nr:hypothetical protein [Candidatus Omnitrophota bacterium]